MLLAIVLARQVQLTVVHVQFKIVPPHGVAQKIRSNVGQKWPLENALQGLFAGLFPDGVFLVGIVGVVGWAGRLCLLWVGCFRGHGKKGVEYPAAILSSSVTEKLLHLQYISFSGRLSAGKFPASLRILQIGIPLQSLYPLSCIQLVMSSFFYFFVHMYT